jgi:hypothetical protein
MTEIKKRAFAGVVGLVAAGLFSVGCSSSSTATPGTGGTTGTAGATGSGGTTGTGTGGSGTGTGGTAGTGPGCHVSDVPASATIGDFSSADGGIASLDGISAYGGVAQPSYTIAGGTLSITDQVVPGSTPKYVGLVIYFNGNAAGTDCVDASAYTGIEFDVSGTLTGAGCSVQYSTNDSEHADSTQLNSAGTGPNDPKASGPAGSYSPQLALSPIPSTTTTKMVPFADSALGAGSPATPIDKMKITGVQWQLTVPAAGDGGPSECDLALTIDNVKFY